MSKYSGVKILLVCLPCNGFGDIIFAYKLYKIMTIIYDPKIIHVAIPDKEKIIQLGNLSVDKVLKLVSKNGKEAEQCSQYQNVKFEKKLITKYDLMLAGPVAWDYKFSLKQFQKLIPYATKENTFSFSEYNDYLDKGIHFNTGIGNGRLGLLFLPPLSKSTSDVIIRDKFAVAYLNTIDSTTPRWRSCLKNFMQMITKKYNYKRFQLVLSKSMMDYLSGEKSGEWFDDATMKDKDFFNVVDKHYDNIVLITDPENRHLLKKRYNGNTFFIRGDILPVANIIMLQYMMKSVRDILITGDQSITDVLSCCPKKNIWYQIAPWKENFGYNLAKELHHKFLLGKKTSCGTIGGIKYESNNVPFVRDNDFKKNFRPLMDEIMENIRTSNKTKKYR